MSLKVLYVTLRMSPESGGTTQAIVGLTRSLTAQGVEVGLVTTTTRARQNPYQDSQLEIRTFREGWLSDVWTGRAPGLHEFLDDQVRKYDLLHIHELWHHPHFTASKAARRASKPYVVSPHGMLSPWALGHKAWKKRVYWLSVQRSILKRAAAIHALSDDEVNHIRDRGLDNLVALIPNGIDPGDYQALPPRDALYQLYPELEGKQVVLFLGRIHPIKGLDLLASAFGEIARQREDVCLVVAGPDNYGYRSQIESILREKDVLQKCVFTGMLTGREKLAVLGGSDILVLPSYSEVRGLVTLEGMICRLPVIITKQCSFPEVTDAGAGLVIDTDSNQLARAMETLLDKVELRRDMGQKGRKLVLERFTWDRVAGRMLDLYGQILNKGPGGHAVDHSRY